MNTGGQTENHRMKEIGRKHDDAASYEIISKIHVLGTMSRIMLTSLC